MKHGKVIYTLIYREDGERKEKAWIFAGAPTGKKYKEWTDIVSKQSKAFWMDEDFDRDYLASSWKGAGKKK